MGDAQAEAMCRPRIIREWCPRCNGSCTVNGFDCYRCGGRGWTVGGVRPPDVPQSAAPGHDIAQAEAIGHGRAAAEAYQAVAALARVGERTQRKLDKALAEGVTMRARIADLEAAARNAPVEVSLDRISPADLTLGGSAGRSEANGRETRRVQSTAGSQPISDADCGSGEP